MGRPCYYTFDKIAGKVHIPGCLPAAVHGPDRCVCKRVNYHKQVYDEIDALAEKVKKLTSRIKELEKIISKNNLS